MSQAGGNQRAPCARVQAATGWRRRRRAAHPVDVFPKCAHFESPRQEEQCSTPAGVRPALSSAVGFTRWPPGNGGSHERLLPFRRAASSSTKASNMGRFGRAVKSHFLRLVYVSRLSTGSAVYTGESAAYTGKSPRTQANPPRTQADPPRTQADPPRTQADPPRTQADPPRTQADPPRTQADPPRTQANPPRTQADPPRTQANPPRTQANPRRTQANPRRTQANPSCTQADPTRTQADPPRTRANPLRTQPIHSAYWLRQAPRRGRARRQAY